MSDMRTIMILEQSFELFNISKTMVYTKRAVDIKHTFHLSLQHSSYWSTFHKSRPRHTQKFKSLFMHSAQLVS